MSSRWFNIAVVLLWLASMGWLITEKVLPPMLIGEPPTLSAAADTPGEAHVPVSWQLYLDDQPLGWATSHTVRQPQDLVELRSRVHLDRFPIKELAPAWLLPILEPLGGPEGNMPVDTDSTVELTGGRLKGFRTTVHLGSLHDAILLSGVAKGKELEVSVRLNDFAYTTTTPMSGEALIGDGLSPRSRLARLHVGQTWTEPIYSPFHPPNSPLQILQAEVEREESISWNGEIVRAMLVVYRNDPGSASNASRMPRGRAWVRDDGAVLRQEILVLGSRLVFVRLPPGESPDGRSEADASGIP